MTIEPIIVIFLSRYLRKRLQTSIVPGLDKILVWSMYFAIALLVAQLALRSEAVTSLVGHLLLLFILSIPFWREEFRMSRNLMYAFIPLVAFSLCRNILELADVGLYNSWKVYLDIISIFAFVWLVAMWFITNKQAKALAKERKKREEEERQNLVMAAMRDELEIKVAERTVELTNQKEELQQALTELKSTQFQLVQSEKMASLGELTAGIAHEIQNPLNFVNNFSEVSVELLNELKEGPFQKLSLNEKKIVEDILEDISQNLQKITHHGKRADAIVKGMLQHSRSSTGQKEPTDINALADEYLRLSYHGLRAKDKSFNAVIQTDFDRSLGKINVIPQDVGRVLLNLFTNAFYSVAEKKKKQMEAPGASEARYEPTVSVSTKKIDDKVEIRVRDNGLGISQRILDKIYQPFFSTKPTGQGTGLGLSISYDIINKVHGGQMKVETMEGEFAEFVILLPV